MEPRALSHFDILAEAQRSLKLPGQRHSPVVKLDLSSFRLSVLRLPSPQRFTAIVWILLWTATCKPAHRGYRAHGGYRALSALLCVSAMHSRLGIPTTSPFNGSTKSSTCWCRCREDKVQLAMQSCGRTGIKQYMKSAGHAVPDMSGRVLRCTKTGGGDDISLCYALLFFNSELSNLIFLLIIKHQLINVFPPLFLVHLTQMFSLTNSSIRVHPGSVSFHRGNLWISLLGIINYLFFDPRYL